MNDIFFFVLRYTDGNHQSDEMIFARVPLVLGLGAGQFRCNFA